MGPLHLHLKEKLVKTSAGIIFSEEQTGEASAPINGPLAEEACIIVTTATICGQIQMTTLVLLRHHPRLIEFYLSSSREHMERHI